MAPVGLDWLPLGQCKPALDSQLVAVGGNPEIDQHRDTEHSSDSEVSLFPQNFASSRSISVASLALHLTWKASVVVPVGTSDGSTSSTKCQTVYTMIFLFVSTMSNFENNRPADSIIFKAVGVKIRGKCQYGV